MTDHHNRRKMLVAAAAMIATLALAACSSSSPSNSNSAPAAAQSTAAASSQGVKYPLAVSSEYFTMLHPSQALLVKQTIPERPKKVLVEGQQAIDFMVYFGLQNLIYGVASPDPTSSLPAQYQPTLKSLKVIDQSSFLTKEEVYAAGSAGVDLFLTTNPSMIRQSGLDMSDLNNLGINYIYTFDETFKGSANTGEVETIDQIFDMYRDMGAIFGISNKVNAYIAQQQAEMKSIQSKVAAAATGTAPTVEFIYYGGSAAGIYGNYTGSIIQQYVEMGGGKWVVPAGSVSTTSVESLIALNPDIIIVSSNPAPQTPFTELPALQDMTAFKNHRVYVSDNLPWTSNSGGLFLADTAKQVAGYINPEIKF